MKIRILESKVDSIVIAELAYDLDECQWLDLKVTEGKPLTHIRVGHIGNEVMLEVDARLKSAPACSYEKLE